jgi:hypothetical protein
VGRPRGNVAEAALDAVPELTRGGLSPASLGQVRIIVVTGAGAVRAVAQAERIR